MVILCYQVAMGDRIHMSVRIFGMGAAAVILAAAGLAPVPEAAGQSPKKEIILNPNPVLKKARSALLGGDSETAIELLTAALREGVSEQQRPDVHNQLCVAHNLSEEHETALDHCEQALTLRPYSWRYYNNRGNAHMGLGDYAAALADYQRGLELEPDSPVLERNIEMAQEHLDDNG